MLAVEDRKQVSKVGQAQRRGRQGAAGAAHPTIAHWDASGVLELLPGAKVVFDHFPMVKLMDKRINDIRRAQLEAALKFNEPLSTAYYLKKRLLCLWGYTTEVLMRFGLECWIADAIATGLRPLTKMAATLRIYFQEILNSAPIQSR